MPPLGIFGKFFGRTVSEGAAFAAGVALGPVLGPVVQEEKNAVNQRYPFRPLDPGDVAGIVAEDVEREEWGVNEASYHGVDEARFRALYGEALTAPGIALLYETWRRGLISDGDFAHGLRKSKLERRWDQPLRELRETLLSSEELAMLQQQGFVSPERANEEGGLQGVTDERQQLRFEASGLPPGVETALEMLRRSIIDDPTFEQIVREGHTKTKYTDEFLALRDRVLSATTYATLHLKGWIGRPERDAGGALTGYAPAEMEQMYLAMGRPAAPGQMATAAARGIDGPDGRAMDREQFLKGIKESDIRPEWGPMLWDARFLYPPLFQLTRLVQSHAISPEIAAEWATKDRYPPEVVSVLLAYWRRPTSAAQKEATASDLLTLYDGGRAKRVPTMEAMEALGYPADEATRKLDVLDARRVRGARDTAIGGIHTAYKKQEIDDNDVTAALDQLGVATWAVPQIVDAWRVERNVSTASLTRDEILGAYRATRLTLDQARAALQVKGMTLAEANTFLGVTGAPPT